MSWNEPGGQNHNPWGGGKKTSGGPPDLDEILRRWFANFNAKLAGGRPPSKNTVSGVSLGVIAAALLALYLMTGIYIIQPREQAVVLRFGQYLKTVSQGPHWRPRFVDRVEKVNVETVRTSLHRGEMLTKDENIVSVELVVQYRVGDVRDYLLNVDKPDNSVKQATDSAMRQVIGHSTLDDILTSGRDQVRAAILDQIILILSRYNVGIIIVDVAMQPAKAPEAVKAAFDDAIKAQEDEQRMINKANAYRKQIVPVAEGHAARVLQEAKAYKAKVTLAAEGESARFLELLPEYKQAPDVMRERLSIDAMQSVLSRSSKIFLDAGDSHPLLYIPLDKNMPAEPVAAVNQLLHQPLDTGSDKRSLFENVRDVYRGEADRSGYQSWGESRRDVQ